MTVHLSTHLLGVGNNTGIPVPDEAVEQLGAGRRPKVRVTVNGHAYRSSIASMGGRYLISFSSALRKETGLAAGDHIEVDLEVDGEPRVTELPEDLAAALEPDPGARAVYDRLAPSHAKAYVTWVLEAKRPQTRARRVSETVRLLREGRAQR